MPIPIGVPLVEDDRDEQWGRSRTQVAPHVSPPEDGCSVFPPDVLDKRPNGWDTHVGSKGDQRNDSDKPPGRIELDTAQICDKGDGVTSDHRQGPPPSGS